MKVKEGRRGYCISVMTYANRLEHRHIQSHFPLPFIHLLLPICIMLGYNALNVSYLISRTGNDALLCCAENRIWNGQIDPHPMRIFGFALDRQPHCLYALPHLFANTNHTFKFSRLSECLCGFITGDSRPSFTRTILAYLHKDKRAPI